MEKLESMNCGLSSLAALIAAAVFVCLPVQADELCHLRLGVLLPLTGPASTMGDHFRQSMELAQSELLPEIKERLILKFEDTAMNPAKAVSSIKSLIEQDQIDLAVVTFAESVSAVMPIVERRRITTFTLTPIKSSVSGKKYSFRHWLGSESMAPVLVKEILKKGIRKVGIVFSEHPAMSDFATQFKKVAMASGVEILIESSVLPFDTDFRTTAALIASKKPQAIVYFLLPPQISIFAKQVSQFKLPLYSFINTESLSEIQAANGSLEGVTYAGTKLDPEFVSKFKRKFNGDYPESYSGNLYDIVKIIGAALKANRCNSEEVHDFLETLTSFSGALGTYGVDREHEFNFPVVLKTISNGDFRDM